MSREYFHAYHSYLKSIEPLSDAERGRLFTACLIYSMTGEEPELRGSERFLFPTIREQIDRDRKAYDKACKQNRQNIIRRYTTVYEDLPEATESYEDLRKPTKSTKEKEKEKEKEVKEKTPNGVQKKSPNLPIPGDFSVDIQDALKKWIAYKSERRENYKPTGWDMFVSRVRSQLAKYPEQAVIDVMEYSMSNNWQGVAWDRLKKGATYEPQRRNTADSGQPDCGRSTSGFPDTGDI